MTGPWERHFGTSEKAPVKDLERKYVDVHCHCLPAIDDGPATMSEALALCQALVDDGMATVVATPHQLGRFGDSNCAGEIREKVARLTERLRQQAIELTVLPGADVRVDERAAKLLENGSLLTLGDGGKYVLLELPHWVFLDIEPLLDELSSIGLQAIISHPERHPVLAAQPRILLRWVRQGVHLQLTAGSLLGYFGLPVRKAAWGMLASGLAAVLATDAHDLRARRPCMRSAFELIRLKLGESMATTLCVENPLRLIKGQEIESVWPDRNKATCAKFLQD